MYCLKMLRLSCAILAAYARAAAHQAAKLEAETAAAPTAWGAHCVHQLAAVAAAAEVAVAPVLAAPTSAAEVTSGPAVCAAAVAAVVALAATPEIPASPPADGSPAPCAPTPSLQLACHLATSFGRFAFF
jgi:hypothetical protein